MRHPPRRPALQRIVLPLLVMLSAIMIFIGKVDETAFRSLRVSVTDAVAPGLDAFSRPLAAMDNAIADVRRVFLIYQANVRLSEENRRLLHWQEAALTLAADNEQLRKLLRLVPQSPVSYVTARVIASSGGTYVRELLVDAGSDDGVARGQAVISGEGLVGRVLEVGRHAARILLITDLNSRLPVRDERSGQRGILSGDNSARPLLRYLDPAAAVSHGDRIVTLGKGGIFPPGLPVGVVANAAGSVPRVELFSQSSRLTFLRIVNYGLGDALPIGSSASCPEKSPAEKTAPAEKFPVAGRDQRMPPPSPER
ncbi:MAG: rod shape-determining protein MreC [Stellaceae bacterium]